MKTSKVYSMYASPDADCSGDDDNEGDDIPDSLLKIT